MLIEAAIILVRIDRYCVTGINYQQFAKNTPKCQAFLRLCVVAITYTHCPTHIVLRKNAILVVEVRTWVRNLQTEDQVQSLVVSLILIIRVVIDTLS